MIRGAIEVVKTARYKLRAIYIYKKSYVDIRLRHLEFCVDDLVMLNISPFKSMRHFGNKVKLAPYYIENFTNLEMIGHVAYHLEFLNQLVGNHIDFYISMLLRTLETRNGQCYRISVGWMGNLLLVIQ